MCCKGMLNATMPLQYISLHMFGQQTALQVSFSAEALETWPVTLYSIYLTFYTLT